MDQVNQILSALSEAERRRLLPMLDRVPLHKGRVLFEPNDAVDHAYFPTSGLISLLAVTPNDEAVELAVVGNDGFLGLPILHHSLTSPYQVVVHISGTALRMKAAVLRTELRACPSLQPALLRYAHEVHVQIARGALCHRFHTTPKRLSRWLLDAVDRLDSDTLEFTQELLAHVLGVPRTTVSDAAIELQDAGSIWYRHGRIVIKDRQRLKMAACACYRAKHDGDRAEPAGGPRPRIAIVR